MADSTITGLPAASTLTGAEVLPVVQSGSDVKTTVTAVSDFAALTAGISLPTIVQRITNWQSGSAGSTTLFSQNGYVQVSGAGGSNLTQTIAMGISGYEKAVDLTWLTTAGSANAVAFVTRNSQAVSNANGQNWTTGATFQAIFYGSLMGYLPDGGNNVEYRYGFFYDGFYSGSTIGGHAAYATDPFASVDSGPYDGAAAYFYVDNSSGFWKCKSGSDAAVETTTTSVTAAINILRAFRIKIGTAGAVQFWIDDVLVATHNTGVITSGKQLSECFGVMNKAGSSATAHGWAAATIAFRAVLPSTRTGFYFV